MEDSVGEEAQQLHRAPADIGVVADASLRDSFEAYFRREYKQLVRFALYSGARDIYDADDVVAESLRQLHTRWLGVASPDAWLRVAIVRNLIRLKQAEKRYRNTAQYGVRVEGDAPDLSLNMWEDKQWVEQTLAQLPSAQQEVMRLIVDGFSSSEVAELLGKTSDAIRQNLHLARQRLKAALNMTSAIAAASSREVTR